MKKFSYKAGILTGLFYMPAARAVLACRRSDELHLISHWIIYYRCRAWLSGNRGQPFVTVLGPESGGHFRLNLAQTFNSFGAIIAVVFGQSLILSNVRISRRRCWIK